VGTMINCMVSLGRFSDPEVAGFAMPLVGKNYYNKNY